MTNEQAEQIQQVALEMHRIERDRGFHDGDELGEPLPINRVAVFVANLHEEASELWEAARRGKLDASCDKPVGLTCAEEELADIVIRCMDTAVSMGVDLGAAIAVKAAYNRTRERMHGKRA